MKLNPSQQLRTGLPSIHLLCMRFECPMNPFSIRALRFGQSRGPFDIPRSPYSSVQSVLQADCGDCDVIQTPQSAHYAHDVQCRFQNVRGMRLEHKSKWRGTTECRGGHAEAKNVSYSSSRLFLFGVRLAAAAPISTLSGDIIDSAVAP
jgi:hypothetical protein